MSHPARMMQDSSEGSIIALSPGATPRRNSTGKIVSSIPSSQSGGKEKFIPNYLRASTSSCHDLCKFGRKHSVDEQPRHLFLLRKFDSNAALSKGILAKGLEANKAKSLVVRSKVMSALKLTPHEKIKAEVPAKGLDTNQVKKTSVRPKGSYSKSTVVKNTKADVQEDHPTALGNNDINEPEGFKGSVQVPEPELSESETNKIKDALTSPVENSDSVSDTVSGSESSTPIIHDVHIDVEGRCVDNAELSIKEDDSSTQHDEIKQETTARKVIKFASSSKIVKKGHLQLEKAAETSKPKIKREISSPTTAVPKLRSSNKITSLVRGSDSSAKPAAILRVTPKAVKQITPWMKSSPIKPMGKLTKTPVVKSKSTSNLPSRSSITPLSNSKASLNPSSGLVRNNVEKRTSKILGPSKTGGKEMLVTSKVSPSPRLASNIGLRLKLNKSRSIKSSGSSKNLKKVGFETSAEKVKEKTIHVVDPKTGDVLSSGKTPRPNSTRHSPSSSLSSLSSFSSRSSNSDRAFNGGYLKSKENFPRKSGTMHRQNKELTPYKLKFRRGRVMNIQSENNRGPTRLKFRPRRVVGSSPVGKVDVQRGSKRKVEAVPEVIVEPAPVPVAETVVLRHQDVECLKRETQVLLLNHVIEETASKLAETRKSKVKALVGAFESVISLRESKPV